MTEEQTMSALVADKDYLDNISASQFLALLTDKMEERNATEVAVVFNELPGDDEGRPALFISTGFIANKVA